MTEPRLTLKDYSLPRLRERVARDGLPAYRADQIAAWVYGRGVEDPAAMTDLSRDLRDAVEGGWALRALDLEALEVSADGTRKGALRAADGALVEAVVIPEEARTTLCVSTQVGCPLACSFCATGALGFTRNLSTAEIVDQVCRMREQLPPGRELTNVVFMGMGEPLLNLPNVVEAVRLLIDPRAFGFAPRRVTVSTAGVVPRIARLLEQVPVNLAVSLHASSDAVRDELVPLNRRFPLDVLMATLRALPGVTRRRPVFFEYTLIDACNAGEDDAARLADLVRGLPCKINVIPLNAHADTALRPPPAEAIDRFLGVLSRRGVTTTLRRSRGADIDAACGQLAGRGRTPGPGARSRPASSEPMSAAETGGHALRDR